MAEEGSLSGQTIKRYRFEERVGEGASADVYRAHDLHLRRDVAVKAISPEFLSSPGRMKQILREARIHARLEHVNIVRVYDLLKVDGHLFLVLRLLKGLSLRDIMEQRNGPMEPREAVGYARQYLRGVGFAHSMGIVHLDLKPHNIQITPAGEALIMDFGVARMIEGRTRTSAGMVAGSPAYMAPEQAQGLYTDARTDIYSLGMTLYEQLAGRHPFVTARSVKEVLNWQIERTPPSIGDKVADVPRAVDRAVMRALAKDPARRFRSCREFSHALQLAWRRSRQPVPSVEAPAAVEVAPEPENEPELTEQERRWDPRADLELPARLVAGGGMAFVNGTVTNLSANGLAVLMPYRPSRGAGMQVEVDLPADDGTVVVRASADVVWVKRGNGEDFLVGLRFNQIEDADRRRIADSVRERLVMGGQQASLSDD
jgi:serine/threonine protein kinase